MKEVNGSDNEIVQNEPWTLTKTYFVKSRDKEGSEENLIQKSAIISPAFAA